MVIVDIPQVILSKDPSRISKIRKKKEELGIYVRSLLSLNN